MAIPSNAVLIDAALVKPGDLIHYSNLQGVSRVDRVDFFDSPYLHTRFQCDNCTSSSYYEVGDRVFITRGDAQ